MRKNEEGLEKDLRTLGRIEKFYNVEENLVSKAKGYLINHQHNIDQLTPEEENRLLGKVCHLLCSHSFLTVSVCH